MTSKDFKEQLATEISKIQQEFDLRSKRGGIYDPNAVYGDKYLSEKNYINIKGLYWYAMRKRYLTGEQIEYLIKENANTFKFLDRFVTIVPNAVDELRRRGVDRTCQFYKQQLKAEKVVEGVRKFPK